MIFLEEMRFVQIFLMRHKSVHIFFYARDLTFDAEEFVLKKNFWMLTFIARWNGNVPIFLSKIWNTYKTHHSWKTMKPRMSSLLKVKSKFFFYLSTSASFSSNWFVWNRRICPLIPFLNSREINFLLKCEICI